MIQSKAGCILDKLKKKSLKVEDAYTLNLLLQIWVISKTALHITFCHEQFGEVR